MNIIKAATSTAILTLSLSQAAHALPQYVITADLGEFFATALNDNGSVVGWKNAPGDTPYSPSTTRRGL